MNARQDIIKELKSHADGASNITISQFAAYMGLHPNTAGKKLYGLPYFPAGTRKLYFVGDIADMIIEERKQG